MAARLTWVTLVNFCLVKGLTVDLEKNWTISFEVRGHYEPLLSEILAKKRVFRP